MLASGEGGAHWVGSPQPKGGPSPRLMWLLRTAESQVLKKSSPASAQWEALKPAGAFHMERSSDFQASCSLPSRRYLLSRCHLPGRALLSPCDPWAGRWHSLLDDMRGINKSPSPTGVQVPQAFTAVVICQLSPSGQLSLPPKGGSYAQHPGQSPSARSLG